MRRHLKEEERDVQLCEGRAFQAEGRTTQKPRSGGILQGTQPEVNNGGEAGDETRERMVHKLHKTS